MSSRGSSLPLAALEAADTPNRAAEGVLLSAGAWAPVLLLLIEIMALTRLQRASAYISGHLHPLAESLTGRPEVLMWEHAPSSQLLESIARATEQASPGSAVSRRRRLKRGHQLLLSEGMVRTWLSSTPLIATIALVSVVLAGAGVILYPKAVTWISAILAAGCASGGAAYGIALSHAHERRTTDEAAGSAP